MKGQLDDAAKAFRAALAQNPNSAETHYVLGRVLVEQNDPAGAEKESFARPSPPTGSSPMRGTRSASCSDKSSRRPEAFEAYSHALEASPDHPDALFNRAKIELLNGKLVESRRDLDRLLKAHGNYSAARFLEAHVCVAEKNPEGRRRR